MNQEKIGKFIAKCRKRKNMTQAQLSEKLNLTSKAISKWETGKCLPDASVMMDLSNILDITVNELLSGEKLSKESMLDKADENLVKLTKVKEASLKATKYGYLFVTIALISLIIYNSFKYGIAEAQDRPEFLILILSGTIFWIIYSIIISKSK